MYDLIANSFATAVERLRSNGAKRVMRIWLSADEVAHRPGHVSQEDRAKLSSDISYAAQWKPERGAFGLRLSELGVPVSIWGDRWNRAQEWLRIKQFWRGPSALNDDYRKILQLSKISLCLLYKGAGNLHTNRSLEIPSVGTLLCAERSSEHHAIYEDGREAVYFDSVEECALLCKALLADDVRRDKIAQRGHERALRNNLFNEPVMTTILEEVV